MKVETSILEDQGRVWVRGAMEGEDLAALDRACEIGAVPGGRLEWNADLIAAAGVESRLTRLARDLVPGAFPVRILAFNKTSDMNWSVPWHQDRVIAVKERHELEGYCAWTRKSGIWHVEPPVELLEEMFFARIHLDDSDGSNGCLQVGLCTHNFGRIPAKDVREVAEKAEVEDSVAKRGDVLFVKALTLHRSSPSAKTGNRRTLRIDYSARPLPAPLKWALLEQTRTDMGTDF